MNPGDTPGEMCIYLLYNLSSGFLHKSQGIKDETTRNRL